MAKYKINYAKLNCENNISVFQFTTMKNVRNWLFDTLYPKPEGAIFLLVVHEDIFVTENRNLILNIFQGKLPFCNPYYNGVNILLSEYSSYEEAYKVALMLKENKA